MRSKWMSQILITMLIVSSHYFSSSLPMNFIYHLRLGLLENLSKIQLGLVVRQLEGVILLATDSRSNFVLIRQTNWKKLTVETPEGIYSVKSNRFQQQCGCDFFCHFGSIFSLTVVLKSSGQQPFSIACGDKELNYTVSKIKGLPRSGLPKVGKDDKGRDSTLFMVGNRGPWPPSGESCSWCREKTSLRGCLLFFHIDESSRKPENSLFFQGSGTLSPRCNCVAVPTLGRSQCHRSNTDIREKLYQETQSGNEDSDMLKNASVTKADLVPINETQFGSTIRVQILWKHFRLDKFCLMEISDSNNSSVIVRVLENNVVRQISDTRQMVTSSGVIFSGLTNSTQYALMMLHNASILSVKVYKGSSLDSLPDIYMQTVRSVTIGYASQGQCAKSRKKVNLGYSGLRLVSKEIYTLQENIKKISSNDLAFILSISFIAIVTTVLSIIIITFVHQKLKRPNNGGVREELRLEDEELAR